MKFDTFGELVNWALENIEDEEKVRKVLELDWVKKNRDYFLFRVLFEAYVRRKKIRLEKFIYCSNLIRFVSKERIGEFKRLFTSSLINIVMDKELNEDDINALGEIRVGLMNAISCLKDCSETCIRNFEKMVRIDDLKKLDVEKCKNYKLVVRLFKSCLKEYRGQKFFVRKFGEFLDKLQNVEIGEDIKKIIYEISKKLKDREIERKVLMILM